MNVIKFTFAGFITAFLGAWGGAAGTNKNWRKVGISAIITLLALCILRNWWYISIMTMIGAFSMGYGIPDPTDEGSTLGRFWYKITNQNVLLANIFTRGTVGLMVNLSLLSIPILKGNWLIYIICSLIIMGIYGSITWRDLGGIWLKGKYLLTPDLIVYGTIGTVSSILIFF